jgi:hypothetical protein
MSMKRVCGAVALACAVLVLANTPGSAGVGDKPEAHDMALVGYNDLQGRSAYQPVIHQQNGRWIAYIGHHGGTDDNKAPLNPLTGQNESNGTSIVDVTDPRHPKYLAHIPGEPGVYEAGGSQMVRVCDGKTLPKGDPKAVYLLRPFGNSAQDIWNVADPAHPSLITHVMENLKGTHKSWWECDTGIAYLVAGKPGWRVPRMTSIYDLSDPAHPVFIRDFGLPGQQPSAQGQTPDNEHGMVSAGKDRNRVYFAYGTNQNGIVQIVDRDKLLNGPKEPTDENLRYPEVGRLVMEPFYGAHTALPIFDIPVPQFQHDTIAKVRNIVVVPGEQYANECIGEARQMVFIVDVTVEQRPMVISSYGVPDEPGDFCARGGRFGTHATNENQPPMYAKRIFFVSYFNGGARAVDIRDPFHPKEIAYFIPPINENTDKRCIKLENGEQRCKVAIQTNNVEVDDRGYIYIVDRADTGMHILQLTGAARKVADFAK